MQGNAVSLDHTVQLSFVLVSHILEDHNLHQKRDGFRPCKAEEMLEKEKEKETR